MGWRNAEGVTNVQPVGRPKLVVGDEGLGGDPVPVGNRTECVPLLYGVDRVRVRRGG